MTSTFIQKTYDMISTVDPRVAGWTDDGAFIIIRDQAAFVDLLPNFFRTSNFRSFIRQLNFYGFRKLRTEEIRSLVPYEPTNSTSMFQHDYFRRGHVELLSMIRSKKGVIIVDNPSSSGNDARVDELETRCESLEARLEQSALQIRNLSHLVTGLIADRKRGRDDASYYVPRPAAQQLAGAVFITDSGNQRVLPPAPKLRRVSVSPESQDSSVGPNDASCVDQLCDELFNPQLNASDIAWLADSGIAGGFENAHDQGVTAAAFA